MARAGSAPRRSPAGGLRILETAPTHRGDRDIRDEKPALHFVGVPERFCSHLDRVLFSIGALILAVQVVATGVRPEIYQFDLSPYYDASRLGTDEMFLLYPPYRPILLAPLRWLSPMSAYFVFLFLKAGLLVGAARLLLQQVARGERGLFLLFAAVAFDFSFGFDVRAGNVALLELVLVLYGARALTDHRLCAATRWFVAAGLLKILPLAFLGTLFLAPNRLGHRYFLGGTAAGMLLLVLPVLALPQYEIGASIIAGSFDTMRGPIDSSLLAIWQDVLSSNSGGGRLAWFAYAMSALLFAGGSAIVLYRCRHAPLAVRFYYFVVVYAICAPRMVTYSLSLLLLPVFGLLLHPQLRTRLSPLLLVALCVPAQQILFRIGGRAQDAASTSYWLLPIEYHNLFALLVVWTLATRGLLRMGARASSNGSRVVGAMVLGILLSTTALPDAEAGTGEASRIVAAPPLLSAYAHNDYWNDRPLLDALDGGYRGVEVDVFLIEGELRVGHDFSEASRGPRLETLYIQPLWARIQEQGSVYGEGSQFLLNIEFKEEDPQAFAELHRMLKKYGDAFTEVDQGTVLRRPIDVVLVGWHPSVQVLSEMATRYVSVQTLYSAPDKSADSPCPSHLCRLFSVEYRSLFRWNGQGKEPQHFRERLRRLSDRSSSDSKQVVRVFHVPRSPGIYAALLRHGVDLIGSDTLEDTRIHLLRIQGRESYEWKRVPPGSR